MPAHAGIQSFFHNNYWTPVCTGACFLDSRFRGNDNVMGNPGSISKLAAIGGCYFGRMA